MKFLILAVLVAGAYASMDANEAKLVRNSWNQVKKNEVDILYTIFKDNSDIQAKFPQFAGKNLDSIKGTSDFALHASRIVSLVSQYTTLLGDDGNMGAITALFNEMGDNHKARGVSLGQFGEFKNSLMNYMKAHTTWGDNYAAAWNDAFDIMFGVVGKRL